MSIARYAQRKPSHEDVVTMRFAEAPKVVLPAVLRLSTALLSAIGRHPRLSATVAVGWFALAQLGRRRLALVVLVLLFALLLWAVVHRSSFRRLVWSRVRSGWRRWWVYGRQWQPVLMAHDLVVTRGQAEPLVPRLRWPAHSDRFTDRLVVDLMPGLGPEHVESKASCLAHAFGAEKCTVSVVKPGRVLLRFMIRDALLMPLPALPVPTEVEPKAIPVGVTEDGQSWALPALGTHLLIAGATGAGKGSVMWSLLRGLAPEIHAGRVLVWGIDPKGGMELGFCSELFDRLADQGTEEMVKLLEDAVEFMDKRTQRLKGVTRSHTPTTAEPQLVVVIDELASLTSYATDREQQRRVNAALQNLLTKGRAPVVTVIGALQDPRKDVVTYRDLFPTRVALRMTEKEQVEMILGKTAWERGATCEQIPASLPGVGYVLQDGQREPTRVRAAYVTDDDLHEMGRQYAAPGAAIRTAAASVAQVIDLPDARAERDQLATV